MLCPMVIGTKEKTKDRKWDGNSEGMGYDVKLERRIVKKTFNMLTEAGLPYCDKQVPNFMIEISILSRVMAELKI